MNGGGVVSLFFSEKMTHLAISKFHIRIEGSLQEFFKFKAVKGQRN